MIKTTILFMVKTTFSRELIIIVVATIVATIVTTIVFTDRLLFLVELVLLLQPVRTKTLELIVVVVIALVVVLTLAPLLTFLTLKVLLDCPRGHKTLKIILNCIQVFYPFAIL